MVLAISSATDLARHVRASEEFSYIYPEEPPEIEADEGAHSNLGLPVPCH